MGVPVSAAGRRRRLLAAGDALDRRLAIAVALVSLAGIGIAGYLTYVHYADIDPVCAGGSGGCHAVQASAYAELAGVPVALLGLVGYIAILATVLIRPADMGRVAGAALALSGFGFS